MTTSDANRIITRNADALLVALHALQVIKAQQRTREARQLLTEAHEHLAEMHATEQTHKDED